MNKAEFITALSAETGETKTACERAVESMIRITALQLQRGETVNIRGFVKLDPVQRPARTGRNPNTGEAIAIPARVSVKAKAAESLIGVAQ